MPDITQNSPKVEYLTVEEENPPRAPQLPHDQHTSCQNTNKHSVPSVTSHLLMLTSCIIYITITDMHVEGILSIVFSLLILVMEALIDVIDNKIV